MMVARVWAKHGLKPQRLDRYMATNDPDFETKAADIIGLYLNPPAHAAVFCVDEKTAIQALDRKDPVLPLSPGRAERHGFEYYRHGTLSLYAAFNTKTGEVLGKTAARHTSAEFVAFLADIVVNQPRGKQIHVIADNLSAHKTLQVAEFLQRHPKVHLHFTPTYSSWLNQVELWFCRTKLSGVPSSGLTKMTSFGSRLGVSNERKTTGSSRSLGRAWTVLFLKKRRSPGANSSPFDASPIQKIPLPDRT
jgi:transposase